jgi:hypothetical protein
LPSWRFYHFANPQSLMRPHRVVATHQTHLDFCEAMPATPLPYRNSYQSPVSLPAIEAECGGSRMLAQNSNQQTIKEKRDQVD